MKTGRKEYRATKTQNLAVRSGPEGDVYYGRVKLAGRGTVRKSLGRNYEDAVPALRKWLAEVTATAPAPTVAGTWGFFEDKYLTQTDNDITLAQRSRDYREECCKRIAKVWGRVFYEDIRERQIASITDEDCESWARCMAVYHVTTRNNTVATAKHIFELAVKLGAIRKSPAAGLRRAGKIIRVQGSIVGEQGERLTEMEREALRNRDREQVRWYPTPEELTKIYDKMRSYQFGPCQAAAEFAELLSLTGCRLSEANRLTWADVDWEKRELRIDGAKDSASSDASPIRYLPFTTQLEQFLKRLHKPDSKPGDSIARVRECRGTLQRACVDLGFRKMDHHDLRHTFASRAVGLGIPIPTVAAWLGHKDGGALLLRTYAHHQPGVGKEWAKVMDK